MKPRMMKMAIAAATILAIGGTTCEAGPILDWLFPNRASRRADSNIGQLTYRIPVDAYQYNMAGYSPTTSYRSVWAPIPVTQYRPVSYVNPLSTGTQTNMLPCSTQEWQARRVPYTSYQPSTLFGGGSGWQTATQSAPAYAGYAPTGVTAGYGGYDGAAVNYEQATPWTPVTPLGVTTNYGSASRIDDGWTVVGSGVSYAAPASGGTGLFSYGSPETTVRRVGVSEWTDVPSYSPTTVTPLPPLDQSDWKPIANNADTTDDVCKNCQRDTDWRDTAKTKASDWTPVDRDEAQRSRTRVTPADESPELRGRTERNRLDADPNFGSDPYRWESVQDREKADVGRLTPVRPSLERAAQYRPLTSLGNSNQVRPAITRDDSYQRNEFQHETSRAVYERELAQPTPAQTVPYVKPIPDLRRNPHTQPSSSPMLDNSGERTAQRRVSPDRPAVPIDWDWNQVDINRGGGLTRINDVAEPVQSPMVELTPPQNSADEEGGWRRVR